MRRTTGPYPTPGGLFTDGDPVGAVPATRVGAEWLNDVQEEICYVIEQAGITLAPNTRTQLRQAMAAMIAASPTGHSHANHPNVETLSANPTFSDLTALAAQRANLLAAKDDVLAAREGLASLLAALARRLNDAVNDTVNSGGAISGVTTGGTTCQVAALTAWIDGYYQETTAVENIAGLNPSAVNYLYIERGAGVTPTFGHATSKTVVPGRIYIGEADTTDGSSVLYALKGRYDSGWQAGKTANDDFVLNHNLGRVPAPGKIHVYVRADFGSGAKIYVPSYHVATGSGSAGVCIRDITEKSVRVVVGNSLPQQFYAPDGQPSPSWDTATTGDIRVAASL